jgi:predicted RNase H-like HicB family nuclease
MDPPKMPSRAYSILVEPIAPEDGGGFLAAVPDLPGCLSDGETEAEALSNVHVAIADWIAHAQEAGKPIPEPKSQILSRA